MNNIIKLQQIDTSNFSDITYRLNQLETYLNELEVKVESIMNEIQHTLNSEAQSLMTHQFFPLMYLHLKVRMYHCSFIQTFMKPVGKEFIYLSEAQLALMLAEDSDLELEIKDADMDQLDKIEMLKSQFENIDELILSILDPIFYEYEALDDFIITILTRILENSPLILTKIYDSHYHQHIFEEIIKQNIQFLFDKGELNEFFAAIALSSIKDYLQSL